MYRTLILLLSLSILGFGQVCRAQIDVDHVISIGRNALYFNDYVVSIGYFNRVIDTRPWLAEPYLYRSIAKISLEDYRGAERDASESIKLNPYISRSYLVRGVAYQNLERLEEAVADYKRGLELMPSNGQMRFNLAVAELKLKRYEDAERSLDSLMRFGKYGNEVYALRAGIALERGDTTLAQQRIAEAMHLAPELALPYKLQASIAAQRGEWYDGIRGLGKAIELEGSNAELHSLRAMMHYQVNNLRAALDDYSRALELEPKHRISLNNRAILRQQVGEKRLAWADWNSIVELEPQNYIARYNRAMLAMETGQDLRIAIQDLDAVLEQYPSFSDGLMQRALIKSKLGDRRGADADYWKANKLITDQNKSRQAYAQALANKKRLTKAEGDISIDKYSLLIEGKSNNVPDARYSSRVRGRVQDRDVSVEQRPAYYMSFFLPSDTTGRALGMKPHYSKLLEDYNGSRQDSLSLRLLAEPMPLSSREIQQLEEMLSSPEDKGNLRYYLRRGIIHSLLQDYEQAILDYNRALAIDSRSPLVLFARSVATMRQSEAKSLSLQDAPTRSAGSRADLAPSTGVGNAALNALAPSALQDLGQLLMLSPDFAYGYYNRAYLYAQNGDKARAIEDYSRAIELAPQLAEAYYNRALLHLSEGRHSEGISDLSQAGELGLYEAYNLIKRMR